MATLKNLVPGQVVYSVGTERAGNTTGTRQVIRPVTIVSIDVENGTATVRSSSWTRVCTERDVKRWRVNKPERKPDAWDRAWAMTRKDT